MKARLTSSYIKNSLPQNKSSYFVWDTALKGFGVRVRQNGRKTYVVQTQMRGKNKRKTIGIVGEISFYEAQKLAHAALHDIRGGTDVLSVMAEQKRVSTAAKTEITVADLVEQFMTEHVKRRCKQKTAIDYRSVFKNHFLPKFGNYKINEVTRGDVRKLHESLSEKPYMANRVLEAISKMYNYAKYLELCDGLENPREGVNKYSEKKRERMLKLEELRSLHLALNDEDATSPMAAAAFRLLLYTGARRGEIQTLKWDYIDGRQAHLPDSKTGRKILFLSPEAKKILDAIPRVKGNDYVIVGKEPGEFLVNLKKPWERVRHRATVYFLRDHCTDDLAQLVNDINISSGELPSLAQCQKEAEKRGLNVPEGLRKLRIHDLRHNFASQFINRGADLYVLGKMLGHSNTQTTERYAHFDVAYGLEMMKIGRGAFDVEGVSNNPNNQIMYDPAPESCSYLDQEPSAEDINGKWLDQTMDESGPESCSYLYQKPSAEDINGKWLEKGFDVDEASKNPNNQTMDDPGPESSLYLYQEPSEEDINGEWLGQKAKQMMRPCSI